ncbi:MAG: hypothetical protein KDE33_28545, partial [Bacteroidetes bacterium]|nr:hypothetical protein [Bacteroidota bacterium]
VPYDTVINTNNDGCGSLRDVVSRVADGDTVYFDPALIAGGSDTITLTSGIDFNKGLTFKGLYNATDTLYISGNNTNRIFYANLSSATVKNITMDSMVFIDGSISGNGGALAFDYVDTLFFTNGAVMNSQATDYGAGIYFANGNAVEIDNTSIKNNTASSNGGGIYSFSNTTSITVNNSTISSNSASSDGGGIFSLTFSATSVMVINSTISGNLANSYGGGIYSAASLLSTSSSSVTVSNSTISGNLATNDGGGIYSAAVAASIVDISSSIVALNGSSNIYSYPGYSITSQGYNIFSNASLTGTVATDQMGVDSASLNLQPLAFNGGTTQTMLPGAGSVAINMGNPTDFSRAQNDTIYGGRRDVGAAESKCYSAVGSISPTACNSYTSPSGNYVWTTSGTYADTLVAGSSAGCDSAITINLTINTVPYDTVINTNNDGCGSLRDVVSRVA